MKVHNLGVIQFGSYTINRNLQNSLYRYQYLDSNEAKIGRKRGPMTGGKDREATNRKTGNVELLRLNQ